jgi:hypothetical protein
LRATCFSLLLCAGLAVSALPAAAHPGGVDANGCHYERSSGRDWQDTCHCDEQKPANPDVNAVARESRENIRHDSGSPNYSKLPYFI